MEYYINPAAFSTAFTVPGAVVDRYLKLTDGGHVKVLLFVLRNMGEIPDAEKIAQETGVTVYNVKEALLYWADAGILLPKDQPAAAVKPKKSTAVTKQAKPARADIARRGAEDEKVCYLLREAQMKFGRNLKTNESSTLLFLYDDLGLDISLILMIVQYALAQERCNISFIEKIAVNWVNQGIDTLSEAERELSRLAMEQQAWSIVRKAFGLEKRNPGPKEQTLCFKWVSEWGFSGEMLRYAYGACVDEISKISFPYADKILQSWHEKGYKKPDEVIDTPKKAKAKTGHSAYDLDLFEKMLNSDD